MLIGKGLNYDNILKELKKVYEENYGNDDTKLIEMVFQDVIDLFAGRKEGFQKCDTGYHDLMHTLQVLPPFIGIINGRNKSGTTPKISKEYFDLGIIGVLLHDTGYIKSKDDIGGTGSKYTFVHIQRSVDFAENYLSYRGFEKEKISCIQNIIKCTGVKTDVNNIHFRSEEERIIGYALGTSDLLGQMSAVDYSEKLPVLYKEFKEAYDYEGVEKLQTMGFHIFKNADDLIKSTPHFYESVVKAIFEKMGSLHTYLPFHFEDSGNPYLEAIEENIKKIKLASQIQ